jgi:hypothetical protein
MDGKEIVKARPKEAKRLDEFCGANVRVWIDGRAIELNRVEILFPTKADQINAAEHFAHVSLETREDALNFLLNVLDHFSKAPVKSVPVEVVPEKVAEI